MNRTTSAAASAGALAALIVTVGGVGVATAANGGSLVLGHRNHASSTTTLTTRHATPLALKGPRTKPPLSVSSSKQVTHLNASELGGKTAGQLSTSGSGASTHRSADFNATVGTSFTKLASTAKLAAGTYYVTAEVYLSVPPPNVDAGCTVTTGTPGFDQAELDETYGEVSISGVFVVTSGQILSVYCSENAASGAVSGLASYASIFAIHIAHSATGTTAPSVTPAVRKR